MLEICHHFSNFYSIYFEAQIKNNFYGKNIQFVEVLLMVKRTADVISSDPTCTHL